MFYWNRAEWSGKPTLKIVTHWTHPGKEGEPVPVQVYTNAPAAELFLNGESLGKKETDARESSVRWDAVYAPGELRVEACFEDGTRLTDTVRTAGEAKELRLTLENPGVRKNGRDTAIVSASLVDADGNRLPDAPEHLIRFSVKRGGRFLCVGSPNKWDHEPWQIPQIHLFENRAQVCAECGAQSDELEIEAVCEGYPPAVITIRKEAAEAVPEVPETDNPYLYQWRVSPTVVNQPDPDLDAMHRNPDFADWRLFEVGRGNPNCFAGLYPRPPQDTVTVPPESAYAVHMIRTRVPGRGESGGHLQLCFEKFEGAGKVVIFGENARVEAVKEDYRSTPFIVDAEGLKPGDEVEVWAVLKANSNFCGICRPVCWQYV